MHYVEDVSSGYKDTGNEMCVYCQNQNVQQNDSKKSCEASIL